MMESELPGKRNQDRPKISFVGATEADMWVSGVMAGDAEDRGEGKRMTYCNDPLWEQRGEEDNRTVWV